MKLFGILAVLTFTSFIASAQAASFTCSSGELGEDSYMSISISDSKSKAVVLNLHETSVSGTKAQVVKKGNSYALVNQTLKGWSEGTRHSSKVDALLIYNPAGNTLNVTLFHDGFALMAAQELACE